MLASFAWLRELCPVEIDPKQAAETLTARGLTVDSITGHGDDAVLEIDVPANRPDCLGHRGLARELAAASGVALRAADTGSDSSPEAPLTVKVECPELCTRYTAGIVRGVKIDRSPDWVVRRLELCGLRSVNNVVDISNLVMLEFGNPVHFFDLSLLHGPEIQVRLARENESLVTLDGVERRLDRSVLVIADADRAVALAGVIGGADSEIRPQTRDVLIEAAWFEPGCVRRTARRLGVQTDASYRFERGVDPESLSSVQALASRWLAELAGGQPEASWIDARSTAYVPRTICLRAGQLGRLLGYQPDPGQIDAALSSLELSPRALDDGAVVEITVPPWRYDLEREADLVEEVARHLGYDRIPRSLPLFSSVAEPGSDQDLEERARDLLTHCGFHEAFGYAMIGEGEDSGFVTENVSPPFRLTNPIADWLGFLRRSILPGLVRSADLNHRRGVRDLRLFEIGRVFLAGDRERPEEPLRAGLVWSGKGSPGHWARADRDADLFDLLGVVEYVITALQPGTGFERAPGTLPGLLPGRCVTLRVQGETVGWAGALDSTGGRELIFPLLLAEIELGKFSRGASISQYVPIPRLTPVSRDLAIVLTDRTSFADILRSLQEVSSPAPVDFEAIDRYAGPPLADGQSSLTVRLTLRPESKTLNETEIEGYRTALIERLRERQGVEIRG